MVASLGWAAPAGAETTMAVDAGYAGSFVAGREVPVRVRVSADRLVRGTLEVAIGKLENAVPVAMAVEVPGGGQKEFLVTAPSGLNQSPDVVVRLLQGDQLVASATSSVRSTPDTELVGILPGALRGRPVPGAAPLAVDAGTARFAAIGEAELAQAPASLAPLSTLVADIDEVARLSPAARAGVLRWMETGGRLLVDATRGQSVPGLPDAWQPGGRGRAAAGLGEVVATEGAVAAGRWSGLVEPAAGGSAQAWNGGLPLSNTLAADAGLRTPEIAWLVGFLVVYVVVVGPVAFFVLRRRGRPELAWVAIPLVAILFSSGSWAVGRNLRKATELVHATVLSTGTGGPVATTYLGVFSRSGGTARIGFPAGWSEGTFAELGSAATPTQVTRSSDGPVTRLPLDAGQFGMAHATGPVAGGSSGAGGLEITAAFGSGGVAGEVRNPTPFRVEAAAVFVGPDAVLVGDLGPGESRPYEVRTGQFLHDGGNAEFRVWGGPRFGAPDSVADFALWQVAVSTGGLDFLAPDAAVAAGWTRDFSPEVRVGGRTVRPEGRTVVVSRAQVPPFASGPTSVAARRSVVRDPFAGRFAGGILGGPGSVVRFVFPDGADTSNLVLPNVFGSAEIWQDGAWRPAVCAGPNCGPPNVGGVCPPGVPCPVPFPGLGFPGAMQFSVPAASVAGGVAYVRVPGPASFSQPQALSIGRSA